MWCCRCYGGACGATVADCGDWAVTVDCGATGGNDCCLLVLMIVMLLSLEMMIVVLLGVIIAVLLIIVLMLVVTVDIIRNIKPDL